MLLTLCAVLQIKSHIRLKATGQNWEAKANEGAFILAAADAASLSVKPAGHFCMMSGRGTLRRDHGRVHPAFTDRQ